MHDAADEIFTTGDLNRLSALVASSWRAGNDRDWSAAAGTLEWSCTRTADHAVDTVLAPALFLASRKLDDYPGFGPGSIGPDATPEQLVEALETATRIVVAVITTTEPDVRAILFRRPKVLTAGPPDFAPRAALELILHGHDVCAGLGVTFAPDADLCTRLRAHTQPWPMWGTVWGTLTMDDDAWTDLLRASGRAHA